MSQYILIMQYSCFITKPEQKILPCYKYLSRRKKQIQSYVFFIILYSKMAALLAPLAVAFLQAVATHYTLKAFKKYLLSIFNQAKKNAQTKQDVQKVRAMAQNAYIQFLTKKFQFKSFIGDKKGKKHICFLGPTSVGKTTLCNSLFGTNYKTGLGQTTQQATLVYQTNEEAYWDARGVSSDWMDYLQSDLNFFKDIDFIFLLYNGKISEIRFLVVMLEEFNKEIVFVRTRCDQWKQGMRTIDEELERDKAWLQEQQFKNNTVISAGIGMLDQIKKYM